MKNFCSRMAWVLCLAVFCSSVYAGKHITARNATAVVQIAAVVSNMTVKNGTDNSTVAAFNSPKLRKSKAISWLQSRVNGTLPYTTKPVAKGRNGTSGAQGQSAGGSGSRKGAEKGNRKKGSGKKGGTPAASGAGIKGASRNATVDEHPSTKTLPGKPGKRGDRLHSRNARREHMSDQGAVRGAFKKERKENNPLMNKAGFPVAKKPVPTRKQRSTSGQPSVPVGNVNFSTIVGQSYDGYFHLVEPVRLNGSHTPFHNASVPFRGALNSRGHAISGLNNSLFDTVEGSNLHLVLEKPVVTGNPAGAVARQLASNNTIEAQVIDGEVTCSDTSHCNVGLIAGQVQGDNNYIQQHNSTGQVNAYGRPSGRFGDTFGRSSGGFQRASLSIGSVEGNNNLLIQNNVSGRVNMTVRTTTYDPYDPDYPSYGEATEIINGTVGAASAGPAHIEGEGNTVIQEDIEANITSSVNSRTERNSPGIVIGAKSEAGLGSGVVKDDQFLLRQTKVKGHAKADISGKTEAINEDLFDYYYYNPRAYDYDAGTFVQGGQAVASTGVAEMDSHHFRRVTQVDTEGFLEANATGEVTNHYHYDNVVPPTASRGAIIGRYGITDDHFYTGGVLQLFSGNASKSVPAIGDDAGNEPFTLAVLLIALVILPM